MDDTGRWHRSRTIHAIRGVYSLWSRQLPKLVIVALAVAACATPTAEQDPSDGETSDVVATGATTTSSPTSATATAPSPTETTGPTPTTTTPPGPSDTGPPRQTITLVAPNGESVDTQGDVTMSTRETLIEHDLAPTSSAGTAVQVVRAGPEGDCSQADDGALVFFEGSFGDACEVALHADGTDGFAPADLVVTIQFEAAYTARWNTSGPRREGCVEPGSTVSDIGVELTADPDVVVDFRVEAGSWFSHDPLGFDFGDASLTGMAIDDDAPIGATISIRVSAGNPGTQVGDIQPPDVFTWTVADPCDDPVG